MTKTLAEASLFPTLLTKTWICTFRNYMNVHKSSNLVLFWYRFSLTRSIRKTADLCSSSSKETAERAFCRKTQRQEDSTSSISHTQFLKSALQECPGSSVCDIFCDWLKPTPRYAIVRTGGGLIIYYWTSIVQLYFVLLFPFP